ncbi:hypothetical protein HG262_04900 [Achromobacter sp. Bel]|nr:hypothetical protein [Achromobacter sp. Bel]
MELAAKAAGMRLEWDGHPDAWQPMYYEGKTYHSWDPLTDDGDALRLAVKLRIGIEHEEEAAIAWDGCIGTGRIPNGDDPASATRRAIVLAAADIGTTQPSKDGGGDA